MEFHISHGLHLRKLLLYSLAAFLLYCFILSKLLPGPSPPPQPDEFQTFPLKPPIGQIQIALSHCSSRKYGSEERLTDDFGLERPLTLIKSVLISAKLCGANSVNFHIFTDKTLLKKKLETKISELFAVTNDSVDATVYFYNAFKAAPSTYKHLLMYTGNRKCGFLRAFLPDNIPRSVKEILYLDTDTIITGNIVHLWNNFRQKTIINPPPNRPPQLAALVQNTEVQNVSNFMEIYQINFGNIKHVGPRGVNSGVMFMNLEAMREFNWSEKIIETWKGGKGRLTGDQQLINVFFHDNLDRLTQFPCQYNFMHVHCDMGLACKSVETDPGGIYIMHGAGGAFFKPRRSHTQIYKLYLKFQIDHIGKVEQELFIPIQEYYCPAKGINKWSEKYCYGQIGKYLFQQMTKGVQPFEKIYNNITHQEHSLLAKAV